MDSEIGVQMKFLRIEYPGIAWHTVSIMLHVFGTCALLGYLSAMPKWTWPLSAVSLTICFYSGYYFELGFRQRRWSEFRYAGSKAPRPKFDFEKWRERRDKNQENRDCVWCGKLFNPASPSQRCCSEKCAYEYTHPEEYGKQTLGDA